MMIEVEKFEKVIAEFFNSPYAVAVDCCTHGIELCLRLLSIKKATCPKNTYISIPMTFTKLNIDYNFVDEKWHNFYEIGDTNIIDSAVLWKADSFVPKKFMVLSFQFKKHLNLGRGGMILSDDALACKELKKMSYDGRLPDIPWADQNISTMGYHYYMTPETANEGIEKFNKVKDLTSRKWSYQDYPDISLMDVFK